jgi:SRSO17 transposase
MDRQGGVQSSERRFATYVEHLAQALGHADRVAPLKAYCTGLVLPGERKSVEPMAARLEPARVQAAHQSLHHFVAKADWSDEALLALVRAQVLPEVERHGPILAWVVDDTGFPKKGRHSVGVARQYCGQIGKQDNCQIAVTLSVASLHASLPLAYRLYLPEVWAADRERRAKAGVPEEVKFRTKPDIALDQIRSALAAGVSQGVVLADAGYGVDTAFRTALTDLDLAYILGIQSSTTLWPPGRVPLPPKPWSGRGRPPTRVQRHPDHTPLSAKDLAKALPSQVWHTVRWREGTNASLVSRFAAVRVRPAHRDHLRHEPRPEEWFLVEWPDGEEEPTKYWLSTLPPDTTLANLVEQAKLRWRIERDYQELKQEIGLGHYEGRGWRGFHHHATLCIAAYGFLVCEKGRIPPSGPPATILQAPPLPKQLLPPRRLPPGRSATSLTPSRPCASAWPVHSPNYFRDVPVAIACS